MTTLREYNENKPISYLWFCGAGNPTGIDFFQNTEPVDSEDYCDLQEDTLLPSLLDLSGRINKEHGWVWDGNGLGDVKDLNGNTIYAIAARN